MKWTNIFEEEENFESTVKEAVNLEMQMAATIPKMEVQVREEELKEMLKKFRDKASVQLQRLEELCDVYDIPLLGRSSLDVEAMINEIDIQILGDVDTILSKKEVIETAKEMETKEKIMLSNALKQAQKLGYSEAVEILSTTVSWPPVFNDHSN